MSSMTYEQARDQAIKLHKQGMTYPKIEEHLRNAGYKSARTKDFVKALAIRHMVTQVDVKRKKEELEDAREEKELKLAGAGFKETVKRLSDVPGIDEDTFVNLVEALIAQRHKKKA